MNQRKDLWWVEWLAIAIALTVLLIYASWTTFNGQNYIAGHYRSPFYPFDFGIFGLSPALLVFWIPVAFRLTCYYWRQVYYRSYFLDPPGCAVKEVRYGYNGETKFPFILQNLHRYFVYLAMILLILHWRETFNSFYYDDKIGIGVGSVILLLDSVFITIYVFSCHALRHLVGGGLQQFSCSSCNKLRYKAWQGISALNLRHAFWAWISLITIIIADIYVRLVATGMLTDINTWHTF